MMTETLGKKAIWVASALMFVGCGLAVAATSTKPASSDWPNWRGPTYNGQSKETDWQANWPEAGPKRLWRQAVGTGFSSIAVAGGRAYTMGNDKDIDTVWCFDAATGEEIWKHSYPCPKDANLYEGGPGATPTVDGKRVYTFSKKGHLFCLNAATGEVIWKRNIDQQFKAKLPKWGFAGSPLVQGDKLFLNAGSAGIALDKATGETVWQSGKGPAGYATPVPFEQKGLKCLAIFGQNSLIAVNAADGKQLWQTPWQTSYDINAADPIISDGKVFISSGYNKGCALFEIADPPKELWKNRTMRNQFSSCVLVDGYLYGFDMSVLKCVDFKTGQEKWSQKGLGKGSLMAADGKLIILGDSGELVTAEPSPEAFKPISRAKVLAGRCWTVPVLAGGRIYCRNAAGDLVCLDVRKR